MAKTPVVQLPALRVPERFGQQERMLIVQIEDAFRNLSNQIGILRAEVQTLTERVKALEEADNNV